MSNIKQVLYPGYTLPHLNVRLSDHATWPLIFGLCNEYNLKIGHVHADLSPTSAHITLVNEMGFKVAVVDMMYGKTRGGYGYPIRLHRATDAVGETQKTLTSLKPRYILSKTRTDHKDGIEFRGSVRKLRETAVPDILRRLVNATAAACTQAVQKHNWFLSPSTMESLLRFYHGTIIPTDIPQKDQLEISNAWAQMHNQQEKRSTGRIDIESTLDREKWMIFYNRATKAYIVGAVNPKVYIPYALAMARSEKVAADFSMESFVTMPFRAYYDLTTLPDEFRDSLMGTLVVNKISRRIASDVTRPMDEHEFFLTHSTAVFNPELGTVEYCNGRYTDGVILIDKA